MYDNCARSMVKVTRSRGVSADKNAITRQRRVISTSISVGFIDVEVNACDIHSRPVGQTNRRQKYGGHSAYKMQKSTENVAISRTFFTLLGNRGRQIINNRFSACAVQMLLRMAVNETMCSTFEVKYGKSTSTRTTAIGHLGYL